MNYPNRNGGKGTTSPPYGPVTTRLTPLSPLSPAIFTRADSYACGLKRINEKSLGTSGTVGAASICAGFSVPFKGKEVGTGVDTIHFGDIHMGILSPLLDLIELSQPPVTQSHAASRCCNVTETPPVEDCVIRATCWQVFISGDLICHMVGTAMTEVEALAEVRYRWPSAEVALPPSRHSRDDQARRE